MHEPESNVGCVGVLHFKSLQKGKYSKECGCEQLETCDFRSDQSILFAERRVQAGIY